jgi:dimethylamine monooxygenase subunit C
VDFTSVPQPPRPLPQDGAGTPAAGAQAAGGHAGRATAFLRVTFGASAAEAWPGGRTVPGSELRFDRADAASLAVLAGVLEEAAVGLHVVLAGPQLDIYAARAAALKAGMVQEELTLVETESGEKAVYCPHCRATTRTNAAVGATVHCTGCQASLVIYHHFSRCSARYLGFAADAEEAA